MKLVLSPAQGAKALAKIPAPIASEIEQKTAQEARKTAAQEVQGAALARCKRIEALLRECFPAAFYGPPRPPLAIGIHQQILDVAGGKEAGEIHPKDLSRFLSWWTGRYDYLDALAHGEMRVNLDGSPVEAPTPDQQEYAARKLYGPTWADKFLAKINAQISPAEEEAT